MYIYTIYIYIYVYIYYLFLLIYFVYLHYVSTLQGIPVVPIKGVQGPVDFPLLGIGTWQYNNTVAKDPKKGLGFRV